MALTCVPLHHAIDQRSAVYVRGLTGEDEQAVASSDTLAAVEFIDRVCVRACEDALAPGQAIDLTAHDRDRILAALYKQVYGPQVQGVATCDACGEPFDFSFALDDLLASLEYSQVSVADAPAIHIPTGRDELSVAGLSSAEAVRELARRCLGNDIGGDQRIDGVLRAQAPILALELDAPCPECGAVCHVDFDIQSILLGSLLRERSLLVREIHQIALTYRWSLSDILSLPRGQRRQFADLAGNGPEPATR
ncbi:MAG TPA: hypothetical protein VMT95_12740 [Candidatus Binatia bacterium]|nr:hypothetical protein [Candidatus Binatia bacterium]